MKIINYIGNPSPKGLLKILDSKSFLTGFDTYVIIAKIIIKSKAWEK